jgi:hypothetical protein
MPYRLRFGRTFLPQLEALPGDVRLHSCLDRLRTPAGETPAIHFLRYQLPSPERRRR